MVCFACLRVRWSLGVVLVLRERRKVGGWVTRSRCTAASDVLATSCTLEGRGCVSLRLAAGWFVGVWSQNGECVHTACVCIRTACGVPIRLLAAVHSGRHPRSPEGCLRDQSLQTAHLSRRGYLGGAQANRVRALKELT